MVIEEQRRQASDLINTRGLLLRRLDFSISGQSLIDYCVDCALMDDSDMSYEIQPKGHF